MPTPEAPSTPGTGPGEGVELLEALTDAVHMSDDAIGGRAVTFLAATLSADEVDEMLVESTLGFGSLLSGNFRVLINGEVIEAGSRNQRAPFLFGDLVRGEEPKAHPAGSAVIDLSDDGSAIGRLRKGFFVSSAEGADLRTISRNTGLLYCPSFDEETLRRVIQDIAYLPKNRLEAYRAAMRALTDGEEGVDFRVWERTALNPWTVFVELVVELGTSLEGTFCINGGEQRATDGLLQVTVGYDIVPVAAGVYPAGFSDLISVGHTIEFPAGLLGDSLSGVGVYLDTPLTRRGYRDGFANFATGGSFVDNVITLGSSPGPIGTAVIVDYTAFDAHFLAENETELPPDGRADLAPYLSDPLAGARCLLEQVRMAGIRFEVRARVDVVGSPPLIIGVPVIIIP